ncbi:MAG: winged helix-turn-helix domain-containing protein, partial [Ktedonobacterales bacterium]
SFFNPILRALEESGGKSRTAELLRRVEQIMKGDLSQVDYEPHASQPHEPRWRKTAQWARYSMVREGLLTDDSARGTWEIADTGRKYLAEGKA